MCDDDGEGGEWDCGLVSGMAVLGAIVEFCEHSSCFCSSVLPDAAETLEKKVVANVGRSDRFVADAGQDGRGCCTARHDEHTSCLPRVWQRRVRGRQGVTDHNVSFYCLARFFATQREFDNLPDTPDQLETLPDRDSAQQALSTHIPQAQAPPPAGHVLDGDREMSSEVKLRLSAENTPSGREEYDGFLLRVRV